jgi:hypothetical protein
MRINTIWMIIGVSVAAGFLLAEVACMLLAGQNYPAAVAAISAVLCLCAARAIA